MGASSFAWLHSHVIFIEWMAASNVLGLVGLQLFRLKVSFLLPSAQLRFHLLSVTRRPVLARPDARRSATRLRPRHTPLDDPHRRSSHGRAAPHPPGARGMPPPPHLTAVAADHPPWPPPSSSLPFPSTSSTPGGRRRRAPTGRLPLEGRHLSAGGGLLPLPLMLLGLSEGRGPILSRWGRREIQKVWTRVRQQRRRLR